MKKKYLLLFLITFTVVSYGQVLNQPANWPNTDWTVTGTYNTDPSAFESDPTLTANFAFDDDDAGSGSDDDICLLYTSPSPRDKRQSRMPSSA